MRKLKGFRTFFLIATILSLLFVSCKQSSNDSQGENITVTVQKDEHVTKVVSSFTLKKGEELFLVEYVLPKIEWKPEFQTGQHYMDDYGAKAIAFTVATVSPRAKVFAQIVHPRTGVALKGNTPIELSHEGIHKGTV